MLSHRSSSTPYLQLTFFSSQSLDKFPSRFSSSVCVRAHTHKQKESIQKYYQIQLASFSQSIVRHTKAFSKHQPHAVHRQDRTGRLWAPLAHAVPYQLPRCEPKVFTLAPYQLPRCEPQVFTQSTSECICKLTRERCFSNLFFNLSIIF